MDKDKVSPKEWDEGKFYSFDAATAQGVYDTITRNRLFIGERPNVTAKEYARDENNQLILDDNLDTIINDYQLTMYE